MSKRLNNEHTTVSNSDPDQVKLYTRILWTSSPSLLISPFSPSTKDDLVDLELENSTGRFVDASYPSFGLAVFFPYRDN